MQKGYEAGLTPARLRDTGAQSLCAKISLADSSRSVVNCGWCPSMGVMDEYAQYLGVLPGEATTFSGISPLKAHHIY
jgi:hypothetical protein